MSLYQCQKCGCVENTAIGFFHCRESKKMWSKDFLGKKLCSACGPVHYKDGQKTEYGKWHKRFKRRYFPLDSLYTDKEGNVRLTKNDKYPTEEDEIEETKNEQDDRWTMPEWMEKYLDLVFGGKKISYIEGMANDKTLVQINAPRALIACEIKGRISALESTRSNVEETEAENTKMKELLSMCCSAFYDDSKCQPPELRAAVMKYK